MNQAESRLARATRRLGWTGWLAPILLGIIVLAVALGPLLWPLDADQSDIIHAFAPFSAAHPLGTDEFGRDILSRLLHGGRLSLLGALVVLAGNTGIGFLVGSIAATSGGQVDAILSRLVDGLLALPGLIIAMAIVGVMGKSFGHLLLALVISGWPWYARAYRGLVLHESRREYVAAARASGARQWWIIWRHIAPNILGPAVVLVTTNLGGAILSLTALSFLGLGVQPPQAEWGAMINSARFHFQTEPWVIVAPGLAVGMTVLAVNLLGDVIRDVTDIRWSGTSRER